ncbi:MAG TPA: hypothetical protein PLI51_11935 [bacterium]|nr:hypothetical protein [bacterium]HPQ67429.1 hypothetical protein [bacterium]
MKPLAAGLFALLAFSARAAAPPSPLPPPPARLIVPMNGAVVAPDPLSRPFSWSAVPGAARYRLEISADRDFAVVVDDRLAAGTDGVGSELPPGTFFWRVSSLTAEGLEGPPCGPRLLVVSPEIGP